MAILVINTSLDAMSVDIVDKKGKKDAIFLQARSKAMLPSGFSVQKNFLVRNPKIKVKEK